MEFTTARKLIQKAHIELLHQNMQETGPWWERCLLPALLWRPCLPSSVSRIELLFPEDTAVLPAHTHTGLLLLMTARAGNKGAQTSQDLDLPSLGEAVYPHHSHSERDVLICHIPVTRSGWILLQHQQLYWLLCVHVSISRNKNLYKRQNCLSAKDSSKKPGSWKDWEAITHIAWG